MAEADVPGVLTATDGDPSGSTKEVPFPSEDESTGVVSMAWRGPRFEEQAVWTQLKLLW